MYKINDNIIQGIDYYQEAAPVTREAAAVNPYDYGKNCENIQHL